MKRRIYTEIIKIIACKVLSYVFFFIAFFKLAAIDSYPFEELGFQFAMMITAFIIGSLWYWLADIYTKGTRRMIRREKRRGRDLSFLFDEEDQFS